MFSFQSLFAKKNVVKPVVLLVLDGFGVAPHSNGNAITKAKTPNYLGFLQDFPHTELYASGESVGLPTNEVGNTEVGHLTLGAGRVMLQDLKRINLAIEKMSFYENKAFINAIAHVKQHNSRLHLIGLVSSGKVHSSVDHLYALIQLCKKESLQNVFLHAFTDGRDAPPKEGIDIITKVSETMQSSKVGRIATIAGRYYGMDRDRRWNRTEKSYAAIVEGKGVTATDPKVAVQSAYDSGKTDEFIEPTVILDASGNPGTINDNDAIIFFNYRIDRVRQLSMALTMPNFENLEAFDFGYDAQTSKKLGAAPVGLTFNRNKKPMNTFFVSMTEYHKTMPVSGIAYPPEIVEASLAEILSKNNLKQLHLSESEKERFVTYYFDGLHEEKVPFEDTIIIPSQKVATYDLKPEMSLPGIMKEFKRQLSRDMYTFFIINFANADMVGHTGNLKAAIQAIEIIDRYLAELVRYVLKRGGHVYVTADHGNVEEMITYPIGTFFYTSDNGVVNTDHSSNPVPFLAFIPELKGKGIVLGKGALSDVAPTILTTIGVPIPEVMTGKDLLRDIRNQIKPLI